MPDHDDLVDRVGAGDLDQALRAGLDEVIEAGRLATPVAQEIRPMAVDLHHEQLVGQRPQQLEQANRDEGAEYDIRAPRQRDQLLHGPDHEPAAERRRRKPQDQQHLEIRQRDAVLRRGTVNPKQRAGVEIVENQAERARHLPPHRLRHVGADHPLLAQEFVSCVDTPVGSGRGDLPMREVVGVQFKRTGLGRTGQFFRKRFSPCSNSL